MGLITRVEDIESRNEVDELPIPQDQELKHPGYHLPPPLPYSPNAYNNQQQQQQQQPIDGEYIPTPLPPPIPQQQYYTQTPTSPPSQYYPPSSPPPAIQVYSQNGNVSNYRQNQDRQIAGARLLFILGFFFLVPWCFAYQYLKSTNPKVRKYGILSLWISIFYFIAIGVGVPIAVLATKTSFYSNY